MNLRQTYGELARKYSADIYRFAFRLCGNRDVAEDLVQETYYEAWKSIANLKDPNAGKSWLLQILRYRYSHFLRDQKRNPMKNASEEEMDTIAGETDFDLSILNHDELLQKALDSLDQIHKEIFLLVFLEGMSCREVAEKLDLPLGTVLSRIHRARIILRKSLKDYRSGHKSAQNPGMFKRWFNKES